MKRTWFGLLVVGIAYSLALPGQALAKPSAIAQVLGNLRWGMSELEVKGALKGKASGIERIAFDGKRARTDNTMVGEEYTHGNGETMIAYKDKDSENYLFFFGGELWKWVKVYPASRFKGNFSATAKKKFGNGYDKQGEVNTGSGASYAYTEFLDRNTRMRAVDKSSEYQAYVLMFESLEIGRTIASLRTDTIRRGTAPKKAAVAKRAQPADDEDDRSSSSSPSTLASKSGSGKERKSVFAHEQRDETDEEYAARKERLRTEARDSQRRQHERKAEAKKGKILDELAGIDDEDPLSGMK